MAATLKNGKPARPNLFERFELWSSIGRVIDGVWIGTFEDEARLHRVEAALQSMKQNSPLHYLRVTNSLDRIWVRLLTGYRGEYSARLNACELDERFVDHEETTPELIASVIVHEATHARLDRCGIAYDEAKRHRIEAICIRRQLHFVSGLAGYEAEQESLQNSLDYYGNSAEFFLDENMRQRFLDGSLESLRHLGAPHWLVALFSKAVSLRLQWRSWRAAVTR